MKIGVIGSSLFNPNLVGRLSDMTHMWQPTHERISITAAKRELKELNIAFEDLPLIKIADAAIMDLIELGVKIELGDIIRITRNSKVAGEGYRYYRKVVP